MEEKNIDLQNVADTLDQYSNPYINATPSPESEVYLVSDEELRTRRIVRLLFMAGVLTIIGVFIYTKYKK
jgi:hypothetical protein